MERLRALAAVDTHGSIARAAQALHITASGMSQQLSKLERECGHRLLEPEGRSVRLTHAGRVLADHAAAVMSRVGAAEQDLAALETEVLGPLRIGAVGSAIRTLLPATLATLAARHPRLTPSVCDGEVTGLLPALLHGELDLLLIENWSNRPRHIPEGVAVRTIVTEEARVALHADHPLGVRPVLRLADLGGVPWAACPPGAEAREALVQALRAHGVEPEIRYSVGDHATQLTLVASGLTAALIPDAALQQVPPAVLCVPTDPPLRRHVQAAWLPRTETPPVRACLDVLAQLPRPEESATVWEAASEESRAGGRDSGRVDHHRYRPSTS
ncbi:LysR family transcriptional regulator [Streptomyces paromomycinus]|uniref:LysR family transcriptional regulator n=1 Tax=Streptomyces paromomycinus TaxID=92743 RepID=A0A401W8I3_STREY|nr:LysR family transcriptional regulator [Streptomyces paromomycinus]